MNEIDDKRDYRRGKIVKAFLLGVNGLFILDFVLTLTGKFYSWAENR